MCVRPAICAHRDVFDPPSDGPGVERSVPPVFASEVSIRERNRDNLSDGPRRGSLLWNTNKSGIVFASMMIPRSTPLFRASSNASRTGGS
jgi:hypothetical protein